MQDKRWFAPLYMFIVTAAFSSIVIGFARRTDSLVEANAQLALEKAVLQVLPSLYNQTASRTELHKTFIEQVGKPSDESGEAYTLKDNGRVVAYAVPFSGQGFWAPIKGFIGVKDDKKTVTGIAFYEQTETPGLGAEITKPAFKNQFPGIVLAEQGKPINLKRAGESLNANECHAVTGATQTSGCVDKILNEALKEWWDRLDKQKGSK